MKLVVLGLSLSSSWGNGHATTWRALLKALAARGHEILFLERDQPWYAANRDLPEPGFCRLSLYHDMAELAAWYPEIAAADLTIIGSYVPEGRAVVRRLRAVAPHLAFYDIDTPVTLAALERGDCPYLDPPTIRLFDLYLSFTGGPTLRRLERRYGARAARVLFCAADPDLYFPAAASPRWDFGYLGTYSADRQPALERLLITPARLLPERRFVVAGPQYPTDIDWPANIQRIEHLPPCDHAAFYHSLGWTLNITRADMIAAGYSPSVRLFEAAACATAIISDAWEGLDEIFCPGREILIARSSEDILQCLARPDGARQAIGVQARRRFLASHTADHRAALLERYCRSL
jgi:spore maturation protein CgeB